MRVLVNFDPGEREYLGTVQGILKLHGAIGLASPEVFTITELMSMCERQKIDAVLCANEATLQNLVKTGGKKDVTLSAFRGSRLNYSTPVIVLNPLNHIRRVKYGRFLAERDIEKIKHLDKPILQVGFTVCEDEATFLEAERRLAACEIISIDVETSEINDVPLLTCVSFTGLVDANTTISYVIPFIDFGQTHFEDAALYARAILCMQRICATDVPKMMFNATYDATYLIRYQAYPRNLVIDVMGMAHAEYSELPKTLDFVTSLHCYDYYFWKYESDTAAADHDIRAYWHYCVKDSWNTLRAGLNMLSTWPKYALVNYQWLFKLTYPCIYCGFEGWKVNEEERVRLREAANKTLQQALADLRTMAHSPVFNPGSPKQVATFLYDILGARKIKSKNSKGQTVDRATGEKILLRVAEQHPLLAKVVNAILTYREKSKAISTYFDFKQFNGRFMYSLGPFATDTMRFSSRASSLYCGGQVQNVPEYAKGMLEADEGYLLIEPDNNKSEARCVAYQANCPALKAALEDPEKDFYRVLGCIFFGLPYEQVTKELRNKVLKKIVHGKNYMMGVDTFIEQAGPNQVYEGAALLKVVVYDIRDFVAYLLGIYDKKFPEIQTGYKETKLEVIRTHKLVSELGTTRYFFGDISQDHKVFRGAVAHKPQHLSVMILNKGFWRVYTELVIPSKGEFRLKAQVHDSIPAQAIAEKAEFYGKEMQRCMDNPVVVKGATLRIPVEYVLGRTWLDLKG